MDTRIPDKKIHNIFGISVVQFLSRKSTTLDYGSPRKLVG